MEPDNVVLTALKPRGNPIAAGLPGDTDPTDGVTLRLYEIAGSPAQARIRLYGGLSGPTVTDVLEQGRPGGPAVAADGDDVTVELNPADVVTLAALPARSSPTAVGGQPGIEPVQPVYTRYWLHNKGPAPLGNLPVSVHVHPTTVVLRGDGTAADVRVTVGSATAATAGAVDLDVPAGLEVTPPGPYPYDLRAGEHRHLDLRVAAPGARTGRYHLAAQIRDGRGQILEDTVAITVGDGPLPPDLEAVLEPAAVTVRPGAVTELTLRLCNGAASTVRGEAQLLSPYGTWGEPDDDLAVGPSIHGFTLPPGATRTITFVVRAPAGARTGGEWWALARITGFGQVLYTAAVSLAVTAS